MLTRPKPCLCSVELRVTLRVGVKAGSGHKMTLRERAIILYKAADVIGGMPADNIGGFLQDQRLIAQRHL